MSAPSLKSTSIRLLPPTDMATNASVLKVVDDSESINNYAQGIETALNSFKATPSAPVLTGTTSIVVSATDADGKTGLLTRRYVAAKKTLSGASSVILVQVPSGAKIIGCSLTVSTVITSGDGAVSWGAAYSTGNSTAICTGKAFTVNGKVDVLFDEFVSSALTTGLADITITPDAHTFSGGVISAIVYYEALTSITT